MKKQISIVIADDHAILREGLTAAFENDDHISVVGKVPNGKELLDCISDLAPDIVLMDINMPVMDGLAASKLLKKKHPHVKVLILTMYDNKQFILEALSNNIEGFILKMAPLDELKKAIHAIYDGEQFFDREITASFLSGKIGSYTDEIVYSSDLVTERENEIIALIVNGRTSNEIAEELSISFNTVNNHRRNIFRKLKINSTNELIKLALKDGLFKL